MQAQLGAGWIISRLPERFPKDLIRRRPPTADYDLRRSSNSINHLLIKGGYHGYKRIDTI